MRFPEGLIYEDEFINYKIFYLAERVSMIKDVLYYYWQRKESISHNLKYKKPAASEKIILEYFHWAEEAAPDMIDLVRVASVRLFNGVIWDYVRGEYDAQAKSVLKKLNKIILERSGNFFFNPYADFKLKKITYSCGCICLLGLK